MCRQSCEVPGVTIRSRLNANVRKGQKVNAMRRQFLRRQFPGRQFWGGNFGNGAPSAMVREIPESDVPQRFRLLISIAFAGALALTLAGCGRKGPLDPPPG